MAATREKVGLSAQALRDAVAAAGCGSVLVVGSNLEHIAGEVLAEDLVPDLKLVIDTERPANEWELF